MNSRQPSEETPLVSVGLTAYKRPDGLKRILDCVLAQSYWNLEIIVSDNCSELPEMDALLDSYEQLDPRLRIFRQKSNIGMEPNQLFVARKATGYYYLWLHDDDEIPPDYVEKLLAHFDDAENIDLVGPRGDRYMDGKYWRSYHTYSNLGFTTFERLADLIPIAYFGPSFFEHYYYGIFRRETLSECLWEDREFYYKEVFSMFFRIAERGHIQLADDVTIRKFNTGEDFIKWRDANYLDKPLCYKIAGSKVEELLPRTLNMLRVVFRSRRLSRSQKSRLGFYTLKFFLKAVVESEQTLWQRVTSLPRRLFRKAAHVLRRLLQWLLRFV